MYVNAYGQRERLGLDELERADTRIAIAELVGVAGVGLLSCLVAVLPIPLWVAGVAYGLNFVPYAIGGRRRRALRRA
jgi:hypothetical protein